jgi:hypothetical protein
MRKEWIAHPHADGCVLRAGKTVAGYVLPRADGSFDWAVSATIALNAVGITATVAEGRHAVEAYTGAR